MVKQAREMVKKGKLGKIIKVVCEYPQGYAITALTGETKAISNWRANPKIAGCQIAWVILEHMLKIWFIIFPA